MASITYNVAPRFTPGSPAAVDLATATKVVDDERRAYRATLEGVYGADAVWRANKDGLDGIVEERDERSDCWLVTDMITGRRFIRLFPSQEDPAKRSKRAFRLRYKYQLPTEPEK